MMKVSIGYTDKLNDIRHFSLSRDSCKHPTAACLKYCYTRKGNMARSHVKTAYERNLKISTWPNFVDIMNYELSNNERYFRIHASGDFYSLEYFFKWCQIARANPHITFLAYTRNPDLFGYLDTPNNLRLIFSVDTDTDFSNVPLEARKAFTIPNHYKEREHLTQIGKVKICTKGDCSHCLECWTGESYIGFPKK